jgi:CDP-2,3-bis-(O-geranylgeranyl)-sn-glycerol synthase
MLGDHTLVQAFIVLWIMMPAYLANTIAVLTGGKYPIDQEKMHSDGNRILGDGKTWSGLVGGTLGGVFIGFLQINLSEGLIRSLSESQDVDFWGEDPIFVFFLLSFGALFGDMTASFIKRRSQLKRGDKSPLLDMFDFIGMALLLSFIFANDWLMSWILEGYVPLFTLLIVTPILHRGVNIIGYKLGVKNEPW